MADQYDDEYGYEDGYEWRRRLSVTALRALIATSILAFLAFEAALVYNQLQPSHPSDLSSIAEEVFPFLVAFMVVVYGLVVFAGLDHAAALLGRRGSSALHAGAFAVAFMLVDFSGYGTVYWLVGALVAAVAGFAAAWIAGRVPDSFDR